jgi:glutaredoxin
MRFTVYSKDECPYCTKIKQVLDLSSLDYVIYTLDDDFTREEFYSEFGQSSTFPQVICDDKKLGGCVSTVKFLQEKKLI